MLPLPSPLEVSLSAVCYGQFRQAEEKTNALDPTFCNVRNSVTRGKQAWHLENSYNSLGSIEAMSLSSTDNFLKSGKRLLRVTYYVRKARRNIHATLLFFSPCLLSVSP